jgi:hypothetical protein
VCSLLRRAPSGEGAAAAAGRLGIPQTGFEAVDRALAGAQDWVSERLAGPDSAARLLSEAPAGEGGGRGGQRLADVPNGCGLRVGEALRVRLAVEAAKVRLCDADARLGHKEVGATGINTSVAVEGFLPVPLTKKEADRICGPVHARVRGALEAFLAEARVDPKCHVLVCGGATRDPALASALAKALPGKPVELATPVDEMAAAGAAIYGASLQGYLPKGVVEEVRVSEVRRREVVRR